LLALLVLNIAVPTASALSMPPLKSVRIPLYMASGVFAKGSLETLYGLWIRATKEERAELEEKHPNLLALLSGMSILGLGVAAALGAGGYAIEQGPIWSFNK